MKRLALVVGFLAAAVSFAPVVQAQNYPWCEYLSDGMDGGGTNCGFISFDQCMLSARGNGNDCRVNTQYVPPPGPHGPAATVVAPSHHHRRVAKKSQNNS